MSWFSGRTMTLLQSVLVNGYSFENILRTFKLAGIPYEFYKEYDGYPRVSKSVLVKNTIESMAELPVKKRNNLLLLLLEDILILQPHGPQYPDDAAYQLSLSRLVKSLQMDGFSLEDSELVRISDEELIEEHDSLVSALKDLGLDVTVHHLEQSREHFIEGEWDSANGQTRKALEELTKKIAESLANRNREEIPKRFDEPRPVEIRDYLHDQGFLDDYEYNLLKMFYQYSSIDGAHPGLSNETDARVRRFILVGLCQFYVEKYKNS